MSEKKRGMEYKKDIFDRPFDTKVILLLATGCNTSKKLIENGIRSGTWSHTVSGFKKKLIEKGVISNSNSDNKYMKEIQFNWDMVINHINLLQRNDIKIIKNEIKARLDKLDRQLEKIRRILKTTSKKKRNSDKYFEFNYKYMRLKSIHGEYYWQIKKIKIFNVGLAVWFTNLPPNDRNWLIVQLINYFELQLLVSEEFKSFNDIIRRYLFSFAYNQSGSFSPSGRGNLKDYPFDPSQVNVNKFKNIALLYHHYYHLNADSLLVVRPKRVKETKDVGKDPEKEEMKRHNQQVEEFNKRFEKAESLADKYELIINHYEESDADTWLREIVKP